MTAICENAGFTVSEQSIGIPSSFRPPDEEGGTPEGEAAFSAVTVRMTVSGSYTNLMNLQDSLELVDDVRLTNFSFDPNPGNPNAAIDRIPLTFTVMLLN
jgi:hypothetical protein